MPEIKHQRQKVPGRLASWLGLVAAVALGFSIHSGIHGRVEAESNLQTATEEAAVEDVNVSARKQPRPSMKWFYPEPRSLSSTLRYTHGPTDTW